MTRHNAEQIAHQLQADIEAFAGTLSPDEAFCMTRKTLAAVAGLFEDDSSDLPAGALRQVAHSCLVAVSQFAAAAVGATVDNATHPDVCRCNDSSMFVSRVAATAFAIAEAAAS